MSLRIFSTPHPKKTIPRPKVKLLRRDISSALLAELDTEGEREKDGRKIRSYSGGLTNSLSKLSIGVCFFLCKHYFFFKIFNIFLNYSIILLNYLVILYQFSIYGVDQFFTKIPAKQTIKQTLKQTGTALFSKDMKLEMASVQYILFLKQINDISNKLFSKSLFLKHVFIVFSVKLAF